MSSILAAILIGAVTFRVALFCVFDKIFDRPRNYVHTALLGHGGDFGKFLFELITCHVCLSVWISGAATALTLPFASVPLPVWVWLGACTTELILWRVVNPLGE